VVIEEGAVLGANVTITSSTPIIDVSGNEAMTYHGRVPAGSVVVPGTRARKYPAGEFQVGCALIVGQRTESTDRKTSLNAALRDFGLSS
jgi:2,3,4,5-tetrahydropyridine-2,6-dicarboxylate N-succinyltransferase